MKQIVISALSFATTLGALVGQ